MESIESDVLGFVWIPLISQLLWVVHSERPSRICSGKRINLSYFELIRENIYQDAWKSINIEIEFSIVKNPFGKNFRRGRWKIDSPFTGGVDHYFLFNFCKNIGQKLKCFSIYKENDGLFIEITGIQSFNASFELARCKKRKYNCEHSCTDVSIYTSLIECYTVWLEGDEIETLLFSGQHTDRVSQLNKTYQTLTILI